MNGLRMEEFRKIVDEIYQELKIFDGEDSRCSFRRGWGYNEKFIEKGGGCLQCQGWEISDA